MPRSQQLLEIEITTIPSHLFSLELFLEDTSWFLSPKNFTVHICENLFLLNSSILS